MSKFLSLEWFKDKIEQSVDRVTEKVVTSKLNQLMEQMEETPVEEAVPVPYKKVMFVNNVLTVILHDDSILTKAEATKEDYDKLLQSKCDIDVYYIMTENKIIQDKQAYEKEVKKAKAISEGVGILLDTGDFTMKEGVLYFKKNPRSIPELLIEELIEAVYLYTLKHGKDFSKLKDDDTYQSLKRFFTWACLNPRAEVANDLFNFLRRNSFRITKQGFFVALRNVVTVGTDDKDFIKAISNLHNKVKAVWKESPKNYRVVRLEDGDYTIEKVTKVNPKGVIMGNLATLYSELPEMEENRYTDAHTRTFDIRVGKVVNMPMEQCSWTTADCAEAGLHFTADEIHYVGCGDTSVLILINPMKVVGIGHSKGRCYEYLPIMTVPREEATTILHDISFDTLQLDEDYAIRELENLVEKVKEGFTAETTKHNFNLPSISSKNIQNLVNSLEEMKEKIVNRVKDLT
jgi:hypothetical protein